MRLSRSLLVAFALTPIACGSSSDTGGSSGGSGRPGSGGAPAAGAGPALAGAAGTNASGAAGTQAGGAGAAGSAVSAGAAGTSAGGASAAGAGGGAGATATLAEVQAIFDAHCVTCHDKSKGGLPTYPALSLVASDSKAYLVNKPALETCGGIFVVPGAPDQSYLVHKVSDASPCEGVQMPRPFEVIKPPPLTAAEIATIRSWISAGAQ